MIYVKKLLAISALCAVALAVMVLVACGGTTTPTPTPVTTLEDIFDLLRENGYEVSDLNENAAGLIGASRGGTVWVNGYEIELYRYRSRESAEGGAVVVEQFMKAMAPGSSRAYSKGVFVISLDTYEGKYLGDNDQKEQKFIRHPDADQIKELLDNHL